MQRGSCHACAEGRVAGHDALVEVPPRLPDPRLSDERRSFADRPRPTAERAPELGQGKARLVILRQDTKPGQCPEEAERVPCLRRQALPPPSAGGGARSAMRSLEATDRAWTISPFEIKSEIAVIAHTCVDSGASLVGLASDTGRMSSNAMSCRSDVASGSDLRTSKALSKRTSVWRGSTISWALASFRSEERRVGKEWSSRETTGQEEESGD